MLIKDLKPGSKVHHANPDANPDGSNGTHYIIMKDSCVGETPRGKMISMGNGTQEVELHGDYWHDTAGYSEFGKIRLRKCNDPCCDYPQI